VSAGGKVVAEWERCGEQFVWRVCDRGREREVRRATWLDRRRFKSGFDGGRDGMRREGSCDLNFRFGSGLELVVGWIDLNVSNAENAEMVEFMSAITCCFEK
jgi:hypothetical protein